MPGAPTPRRHERLVRLGTWLPFRPAARMLAVFTGATVSEATARRQTEGAGAAYVALQQAEVERLEREAPEPPAGPAVQQVTVDGALVPLLHAEWGEVETLTIGTVEAGRDGQPYARALSYFSRRAAHDDFARWALAETHARGTETAGTVVGVCDGADWCQSFLDLHRPDAVRILDFPHAVGYLATAAKASCGAETPEAAAWLAEQAHELKHGDPVLVLGALEGLPVAAASDPAAAVAAQGRAAEYLGTRLGQIRYAAFRAAGYPIGSGAGESGNKVVVGGGSKGRAGIGRRTTSTRWWRCERSSTPTAGRRSGPGSVRPCARAHGGRPHPLHPPPPSRRRPWRSPRRPRPPRPARPPPAAPRRSSTANRPSATPGTPHPASPAAAPTAMPTRNSDAHPHRAEVRLFGGHDAILFGIRRRGRQALKAPTGCRRSCVR
ncbi:MAG: hypothetical protein QOF01_3590 [Thermomicrobiales bacterium]|nr:hypothetical protein [Thermomicrobiales bacterium]